MVSDFERFVKIKEKTMKEWCVCVCVGGVWWVLEEKTDWCWREVVGLDLVLLQILIPILPLRVSLSPLPLVFCERRICATPNKRNKAAAEPAVQPGCGFKGRYSSSLFFSHFTVTLFKKIYASSSRAQLQDFYPKSIVALSRETACCAPHFYAVIRVKTPGTNQDN